jgi:hypothetical protein
LQNEQTHQHVPENILAAQETTKQKTKTKSNTHINKA